MRRDPAAAVAFEDAVHAFRELGSPYHLALGLLDQAEHSVAIGELPAAQVGATEAGTIAQRLGAAPLIERADRIPALLPT
jgi:hypothetical protein